MKKVCILFLEVLVLLFSFSNSLEEQKIETKVQNIVFCFSSIEEPQKEKMKGKSLPSSASISYEKLAYVTVTHFGFDGKPHIGHLVVNKQIAKEVTEIFQEIYEAKFPIEKIALIDEYEANDEKAMEDNNTSAFCYRKIAGSNTLSNHSFGMAIDINPLQNPQITKTQLFPKTATTYQNRNQEQKGMIHKQDVCYQAFIKRGWQWGGEWKNPDYQHFEKN